MKRSLVTTLLLLTLAVLLAPPAHAQDDLGTRKIAQTGFKFLAISPSARAAAIADAMTAVDEVSSVALFYNPAGMAYLNSTFNVAVGQTQWIADINYNLASVAFRPMGGTYGVFGLTLMMADYGDILGTVVSTSEQGYDDYETIGLSNPSPTALAVGLGYARALTDRFSVGGHVKYAQQNLGSTLISSGTESESADYDKSTVAFDFGVLYKTGFRSLNLAISARNFARELQYVEENFELPLTFRIGVSMDLMDLTSMNQDVHSLRLALDAERPRDYPEQLKIGGEYLFMNTLALRAGYTLPTDEQGITLGAGLQRSFSGIGFGFDYAYTTFGTFDAVNRFGIQLSF